MATAAVDDNTQCSLCLNKFRTPKFLPCHHTFCQKCIETLVKDAGKTPLRCPVCRDEYKLPPGGVAALKTNFYITAQLNHGLCPTHPAKPLEFFCVPCDVLICGTCSRTKHHDHKAEDLDEVMESARKKLLNHQEKAKEVEKDHKRTLDQEHQRESSSNRTHHEMKQLIVK
jgi:hypothetical protein